MGLITLKVTGSRERWRVTELLGAAGFVAGRAPEDCQGMLPLETQEQQGGSLAPTGIQRLGLLTLKERHCLFVISI